MKYLFKLTTLLLLLSLAVTTSCKKDNEDDATPTTPTTLTVTNFTKTIAENPTFGQKLGGITATTTEGTLSYRMLNQTPTNTFAIDATTGELTVMNQQLYDFEISPTVTAEVEVSNGVEKKTAQVTITLTNVVDLGEFKEGGIVIWLDPTDNTKGKVCALKDAPNTKNWASAKTYCDGLTTGGYSDWYLGGRYDYSTFRNDFSKKTEVEAGLGANGGAKFQITHYWTSTAGSTTEKAWVVNFSNGLTSQETLTKYYQAVRPIRNF